MSQSVTIPRRFRGPDGSGNGGYACGLTARALTDGPAEAILRRPPPIERPLRLEVSAGRSTLSDGEEIAAEARAVEPAVEVPEPITFDEAVEAAGRFDADSYRAAHPFRSCFTCGPDRAAGDGLRLFPGLTRGGNAVAWPWIPDASLDDGRGEVDPLFVWAALDCPSGWAWFHRPEPEPPHVLGKLAAQLHRVPALGERTVAAGWPRGVEGRKLHSSSAIWSADGELLAAADATWIALTEAQFSQFQVAVS